MAVSITQKAGLFFQKVEGKGHGLFCKTPIKSGDVIETCLTIVFNQDSAKQINKTNLYDYYFSVNFLTDEQAHQLNIKDKETAGCLALGAISGINHDDRPNSLIQKEFKEGKIILTLRATEDISPQQEITITYGQLWFEPK